MKNNKKPEVFLIPNGYKGKVRIFFNEKCGANKFHDNSGNRIYHIPENGILITQFEIEYEGQFEPTYFWVDSNYKKVKLIRLNLSDFNREMLDSKSSNIDKIGVFKSGLTGEGSYTNGDKYYFMDFYIGSYSQLITEYGNTYHQKFEILERTTLNDCRYGKNHNDPK